MEEEDAIIVEDAWNDFLYNVLESKKFQEEIELEK